MYRAGRRDWARRRRSESQSVAIATHSTPDLAKVLRNTAPSLSSAQRWRVAMPLGWEEVGGDR